MNRTIRHTRGVRETGAVRVVQGVRDVQGARTLVLSLALGLAIGAAACSDRDDDFPDVRCGEGTVLVDDVCELDPEAASGSTTPGTPARTCGEGTILDGNVCVAGPMDSDTCGEGASLIDGRCVADPMGSDACGPGTRLDDGRCEVDPEAQLACGDGTALDDESGSCLPSADACGVGTVWAGDPPGCTLDKSVCGPGTRPNADESACIGSPESCGPRTRWDEDAETCSADPDVCGPGTRWVEFARGCLPDEEPGSRCGTNTVWDEDSLQCIPDPTLCGEGAAFNAEGRCVAQEEVCATGTVWDTEIARCVGTDDLCEEGTAFDPASGTCVPTEELCGEGTAWNAELRRCETLGTLCGTGTTLDEETQRCVPGTDACAEGTALDTQSGTCVPAAGSCGAGTQWDAASGTCVLSTAACLPGTVWEPESGGCVPSAEVCGIGTEWEPALGQCIAGDLRFGDCDDPPVLGNIRELTVLMRDTCHKVTGTPDVGFGGILVIEEGVTILFEQATSLNIGTGVTGNRGQIRAVGTAESPILFTGTSAQPGWWRGLFIGNASAPQNVLEHVIVEYAGDTPWNEGVEISRAGILIDSLNADTRIALNHVTARHNQGYGLSIRSSRSLGAVCSQHNFVNLEGWEANTFHDNSTAPLRLIHDLVGEIDPDSLFFGNGEDAIHVYGHGCRSVARDQRWEDLGVPLISSNNLVVSSGAHLTLAEGVEIRFARDHGFDSTGRLNIEGSAERHVVLRGAEDFPGSWRGVRIRDNSRPENSVTHLHILEAGSDAWTASQPAGLTLSGNVSTELHDLLIADTNGAGLFFADNNVDLRAFTNGVITDNDTWPVIAPVEQVFVLDSTSTFAGNGSDEIRITGNINRDGTLSALDVPWIITGSLAVRNGATLEIEAGAHLLFGLNTWFRVGNNGQPGYLHILGREDAPVILEGTQPELGWWRGLLIGNSLNPLNRIEHLIIRHGGSEAWDGTWGRSNLALTNSWGRSRFASLRNIHLEDGYGAGLAISASIDIDDCEGFTFANVDPEVTGAVAFFEEKCLPPEVAD